MENFSKNQENTPMNDQEEAFIDYNDDWCFGCRGRDCEVVCCEGPCMRSFCLKCLGLDKFPESDEWFCSKYCAKSLKDICKEIKVKTCKIVTPGKLWYKQTEDDFAALLDIKRSEGKKFVTYRNHMQYRVRQKNSWKATSKDDMYNEDIHLKDVLKYMKDAAETSFFFSEEKDEYINRRVIKVFDGISYGGRVKSKDVDEDTQKVIYLVHYDDGDKEDFTLEGLMKILTDEQQIDNNDDVCYACDKEGELVMCDGPCCRSFCLTCIGRTTCPSEEEWFCCKSRCGKTVSEIFCTLGIPSNSKSAKLRTSELWLASDVDEFKTIAGVTEDNAKLLDAYRSLVRSRSSRMIRPSSCNSWEKLQDTLEEMGAKPAHDFEVYAWISIARITIASLTSL